MHKSLWSGAMLVASLFAGLASASPVTFAFTGSVTDDPFGVSSFGAPISGSFTFDAAATDAIPDASTGSYASTGSLYGFTVVVDGTMFQVAGAVTVNTANDIGVDQYGVIATDGGLTLEILLQDGTQSALSGDALPLTAPSLAAFDVAQFHLFSDDAEFGGTLTSLSCTAGCDSGPTGPGDPGGPGNTVPEPGLPLLFAVGGAAALASRRRRAA